jgi:hypothetical protein
MGRAAVFELLSTYPDLVDEGISADTVWPIFSLDVSPRTEENWLILRWGSETTRFGRPGGKRNLDVWAYQPRQLGVDYAQIDKLLGIIIRVMTETVHYTGTDGSVFVTADFTGMTADVDDPGWDAIARGAQFSVLTREP